MSTDPFVSPETARALSGGNLVDSLPHCPACGKPLTGKQRYCSGRCRAAWSRRQLAQAQVERDAKVRLSLRTAAEAIHEAQELLENNA